MDPRVPQADRNSLQRPLVSSRIQRNRHRCSSTQCGEHEVVGRWPAVRTPRRNGLIRGQAMIACDDFLNEARGAPTDDHKPLIAARCIYCGVAHWESPSDLHLSALSICSVSAAQSLFGGQNLQTCSPPSAQDRFHEFFWEPFAPHPWHPAYVDALCCTYEPGFRAWMYNVCRGARRNGARLRVTEYILHLNQRRERVNVESGR